jgi:MFS family permease
MIGAQSISEEVDRDASTSRGAVLALGTAFFALFCIVGLSLWGLPFFYDFMVQQFGWTRAQVTSGNAISKLLVGPAFGFLAGWMVDHFGPRRLMMAGILMAGAALFGLGSISSLGMFYAFYVLNALGYVCGGPLPNQVLLSRWFDSARGKAMGVAYLGIGLGGAVSPWISHALVQRFGWQSALKCLGLLVFGIAFPAAFFVKDAPSRRQSIQESIEPPGVVRALKSVSFYLLAAASMCSIAAVSGTQQNLKLFLSLDQHYTQTQATRVLSLVLAFSLVGRLFMGWLADRFSVKYVMLLIYSLVALAIPFLIFAPTTAVYAFAVIFGVGLGGDYMIIPLMAAEIFGVQILGTLLGVILTADGIAEAVSPMLVGYLRDVSGSYMRGFSVLIGVALLGVVIAVALPACRKTA